MESYKRFQLLSELAAFSQHSSNKEARIRDWMYLTGLQLVEWEKRFVVLDGILT